jgi:hypothetical protein|tara:strand:+ start:1173 stop:1388 length:216 start_codon:yes stop_codon:yes gene_type:complete
MKGKWPNVFETIGAGDWEVRVLKGETHRLFFWQNCQKKWKKKTLVDVFTFRHRQCHTFYSRATPQQQQLWG